MLCDQLLGLLELVFRVPCVSNKGKYQLSLIVESLKSFMAAV